VKPRAVALRIAAGQGFWGDWLEAPYRQVTGGPIDYLMMDYLAEVTMSILQKQKSRDPSLGTRRLHPADGAHPAIVAKRRIKITANRRREPRAARRRGRNGAPSAARGTLRIGVVTGTTCWGAWTAAGRGHELKNLDTGRPLSDVRDRVVSANAYLGAWPVVEALRGGADIVVTGRVTTPASSSRR